LRYGVIHSAWPQSVTLGRSVPHDGLATVPMRLYAGRQKVVTGVQMAHMRPILAPVTQSGSGALRLGSRSNAGRATRMNHGDMQQGGTIGRRKGHLNVRPLPLTVGFRCNTHGSVIVLCARTTACRNGDAAESFLTVVVPMRAAPAQAIAFHGMVDDTALDVITTETGGSGGMWVRASSVRAQLATGDEVAVREAQIRVDRYGIQVNRYNRQGRQGPGKRPHAGTGA
jgi:hypothetical protein